MRPANEKHLAEPHDYVKRADGSSGYEPVAQEEAPAEAPAEESAPSAADLDAVAEEQKTTEATKEKAWGRKK